jgi:hypothetical protein
MTHIERIFPTTVADHARRGMPYVMAAHQAVCKETGRRGWAVLERTLTPGGDTLFVIVLVIQDRSRTLARTHARLDQTIRTALGLKALIDPDAGQSVELQLKPLGAGVRDRLNNAMSRLVGRRYLLVRVAQPDPNDIEKGVARVSGDDLVALGALVGSRVVFFGAEGGPNGYRLMRKSLQGMPLEGEAIAERRRKEEIATADGWSARYRSAPDLLGIDGPDLTDAFIDRDAREHLGIDRAWPVLVRRDSRSAMAREVQEFGIALLASLLAIEGAVEPLLEELDVSALWRGPIVLLVALVLAVALVVLRLRSDLR